MNIKAVLRVLAWLAGAVVLVVGGAVLWFSLVFDPEEAEQLLAAFYAGMDGVTNAQEAFAVWVGSLMGMLRSCMQGLEP